ncbi:mechanosensitive ion channel family protein [Aetokthonos hydrillicola Thurmond2011]|jgi:MscS family membrane protein|uniref:Mechanosensitive ion channel family protein n=1 Tax=Aetokthonos hydrillicola Thurmond2011 TaxID=2712845 RepID=A0AAP5I2Z6_9CYAN|nr:mechanosensitive ion channel family protein [Aetokthonos hydrillicola]MBO3457461.1 mechanosensitive ion channel family protein [Aetokthonos hydrillicola CCALA 1050]MBW4586018.1 mechanosensitive ion channel family protein [Aetokthonos hydrillicola CCALA 1050]MDR9893755.1 mechanosensitive ion channel family protein [Aetokthonos hydrillicola Thurmond2011]
MFLILTGTPQPIGSASAKLQQPLFLIPTSGEITSFGSTLVISLLIALLSYVAIFYGLRLLFRRWQNEIGLVTLNISQIPVLAILILFSLKTSFQRLSQTIVLEWTDRLLTALMVAAVSYWVAQLFTQVIGYYLKKYAQQSEAMWDDVLIPLLEGVVPVIVYLFGIFLFLQSFNIDLTGIWVALGGATFVIGFALKDILANFFSGLVLLIDTPFQFGDVISLPNGSLAVIKKVGIRLTNLFLIENHCELFIPNGSLESQNIMNLSRPGPFYYYSLHLPLRADTAPDKAKKIISEVILAHPDTLGNIDEKLRVLDTYYEFENNEFSDYKRSKKEAGKRRLIAERHLNNKLIEIKQTLQDLADKIQMFEKGGLDIEESRTIQNYYLDITTSIGLEVMKERSGKRRLLSLEESQILENTLIGLVRNWYKIWSQDPDLIEEDPYFLEEEWERKIQLLKRRINKVFIKISQPSIDEQRLDDYTLSIIRWLNQNFKSTQPVWQDPKVWADGIRIADTIATMDYVVKFYVDNIKLEQCQRGNRIKSEVQGELIRQMKQLYIYR